MRPPNPTASQAGLRNVSDSEPTAAVFSFPPNAGAYCSTNRSAGRAETGSFGAYATFVPENVLPLLEGISQSTAIGFATRQPPQKLSVAGNRAKLTPPSPRT